METVDYSVNEKISLIKNNDFVTRESKISSREGRGVSVSRTSFAYRLGKKYSVNDAFDIVVKNLLLNMNPAGGGSGFYSGSASIDITGKIISVIPGGISHDAISDVSANDHHDETHALATSENPHTGSLPLIDLGSYVAGRLIYGGAADWAVLAPGTENHVLTMGVTYPEWAVPTPAVHALGGSKHSVDTLANLNTKISDATLYEWEEDQGATNLHGDNVIYGSAASTACVGNDSRLSDKREPTAHAMDSASYHTSTDITTLNATTDKHGFLPKLGGGTANYLRADGTWATPTGTVSFGTTTQIPYMNVAGDNFLYSNNLIFNGTTLTVTGDVSATTLYGDGSNITNVGKATADALTILAKAAENIDKGKVVYVSGATGNMPQVSLADNTHTDKHFVIGMAAETKTTGQNILIRIRGELTGVNTDAFTEGDSMYLSTNGGVVVAEPTIGAIELIGYITVKAINTGEVVLIHHSSHDITVPSGDDIVVRMGDSAGANKVYFKDYANSTVASIDSDGNVGVGIASPTYRLTLKSPGANTVGFAIEESGSTQLSLTAYEGTSSQGVINWYDGSGEIINKIQGTGISYITAGNVGIGTTTPAQLLEVSKSTNGAVLRLSNRDADVVPGETAGEIEFWKIDASGGGAGVVGSIKSIAVDNGLNFGMGFSVGSVDIPRTNALFIKHDGNVGINETDPSYALDVNGTGRFVGDLIVSGIANNDQLITTDANGKLISEANLTYDGNTLTNKGSIYRQCSTEVGKTDHTFIIYTNVGNLAKLYNYDSGESAFRNMVLGNSSNFLYLDLANTRVGIGTASPQEKLHIYNATGVVRTEIETGDGNAVTLKLTNSEGSYGLTTDNGELRIYDYSAPAWRLTIDDAGNIGINDTSPDYTLDVNGTGRFTGVLTCDSTVTWSGGGSVNANTAYTHSQVAGGDSVHVSTTENTNWDAAYTHSGITGTPHVTSGEKTTWNAKSDLALGETSATAYRGDRGKIAYDHSQNNNQAHTDYLKNDANDETSGWLKATNFHLGSDVTLKKDIIPLADQGLCMALKLNPVQYHWKDKNRGIQLEVGYIANEVEKVCPSLVDQDSDGLKILSYSKITSINTAGIHGLYNKFESVEKRFLRLERENIKLKNRIKILENGSS